MGLGERDYIHERRRADDRLLPPGPGAPSRLWAVLALLAGAVLVVQLHGFYEGVLERKRFRTSSMPAPAPTSADEAPAAAAAAPRPQRPNGRAPFLLRNRRVRLRRPGQASPSAS